MAINNIIYYEFQESPVGRLLLMSDGRALTDLHIIEGKYVPQVQNDWVKGGAAAEVFKQTMRELSEYFASRRRNFDVPLAPRGTEFQKRAWMGLLKIPFGETRTYREQATLMGQPTATRAVGAANGKNPIGIIIPCHRVIGADGALTGYAGGLHNKLHLLRLEGVVL